MSMILGLIAAALVLVFFEILLPGGVLGVLAALCVLAATWFGFESYGVFGAAVVFLGTLVAIGLLAFLEFKLLANTPFGRKFFLKSAVEGHTRAAVAEDSITGKQGVALTRLNPSGKVAIGTKTYEASSQDGYIERDEAIQVVAQDSFKLIIKKL